MNIEKGVYYRLPPFRKSWIITLWKTSHTY